jgi:glycosyltransferase involved in cell wall biosynthesis
MCFGMTLYNKSKYLPEAIESLLNQTYSDFYLVALDDCSTDETEEIMREYEAKDERISYFRNKTRKGMIDSWRKAFFKALELHNPYYFAWASDHDRWHGEWLSQHIDTLNTYPKVVLAYPETISISEEGEALNIEHPHAFETYGMSDLDHLYHLCTGRSSPGYAVYGLFRVKALLKAGVLRRVVMPDRLLMTEIGAYGAIKQISQKLWFRRFLVPIKKHEETVGEQTEKLFGGNSVPIHAYCPFISHVLSVLFNLSILPADGDYSNFWKGLLMSSLLWEKRRKSRIEEEFAVLHRMLGMTHDPSFEELLHRNEVREDLFQDAKMARELGVLAESLFGPIITDSRVFANLLSTFVIGLMMYRDRGIQTLWKEIDGKKVRVSNLKKEKERQAQSYERRIAELKGSADEELLRVREELEQRIAELKGSADEELLRVREELEHWKREATLGVWKKLLRKIKGSEKSIQDDQ